MGNVQRALQQEFVGVLQEATSSAAGWLEVATVEPTDTLAREFSYQSAAVLYGNLAGLLLSGR